MVGLICLFRPLISIPGPSISSPIGPHHPPFYPFPPLTLKTQPSISTKPLRFLVFAENNNNGLREQKQEDKQEQQIGSNGDDDSKKDQRPIFNFSWGTLLDPDPDNVLAIGLTGLLTWASVQVLWQLLFISLAILVAALKYSFIAALLLFILITLL